MKIFLFVSGFAVGMSVFLLGLKIMGTALESVLGHRLRFLFTVLTATKGRSVLAGLLGTCLVQSSSAVASAMVILVDNGVLSVPQAFGVILGANIGTTLTAQIIAFPLNVLAWPLLLGGLFFFSLRQTRPVGMAIFGLGALFYGLNITTTSLSPLLQLPLVQQVLVDLTHTPLQAIFLGLLLTALVQSSSAVTGLVVSLTNLKLLSLQTAVGLALGSNIGTVITTLIAGLGRDRASKATAYADFLFNLGGVLLILPIFPLFLRLVAYTSIHPARQVANAHTLFNALTALLALPFLDYLAGVAWCWAGIRRKNKNTKG